MVQLDVVNTLLRILNSMAHVFTPEGQESSVMKILSNVLTATGQVLSAAHFTTVVQSMAPAESETGLVLVRCQGKENGSP